MGNPPVPFPLIHWVPQGVSPEEVPKGRTGLPVGGSAFCGARAAAGGPCAQRPTQNIIDDERSEPFVGLQHAEVSCDLKVFDTLASNANKRTLLEFLRKNPV